MLIEYPFLPSSLRECQCHMCGFRTIRRSNQDVEERSQDEARAMSRCVGIPSVVRVCRIIYSISDFNGSLAKLPIMRRYPSRNLDRRSYHVIHHRLTNNHSFVNLLLFCNLWLCPFHTTRNIDPISRVTVREDKSVINCAFNQRS